MQDEEANEAGLEQWEMVVGASRLYDWHESRLRAPRINLHRTFSSDSQAADTLRSSARCTSQCTSHYFTMFAVRSCAC
jgi:hypothetical protein